MEKRIKIVWLLSLVSALVIIGAQGYWLYTQYRHALNIRIGEIVDQMEAVSEMEYMSRKENGAFSYSMVRETAYSNEGKDPKKITTIAFSSGETEEEGSNSHKIQTLDSVMKAVNNMSIEELSQKEGVYIRKMKSNYINVPFEKNDTIRFEIYFDHKLPEDSIIWGVNRAMANWSNPFQKELLDSLLHARIPEVSFTVLDAVKDTVNVYSFWQEKGSIFAPQIDYYYAYSPFQKMGVWIKAEFPPFPLFRGMVIQLGLAFGLVLLLIGCLIFQIKTILKQRKIGEIRQHFVNTMIHELKRPVQTLKTFVAFLGDKQMRADEQMTEQIVQDSMFELDNLSAYLSKLKDMVRADDESTPLHISRFKVDELIDKVIRLTHIPKDKEVTFHTHFEMESPLIEADPIHVANVVSNLIENAIKYSGQKVTVTVEARRKRNELWLTVSDDGIGIPLVEQEKVFAKFYRGSNLPDLSIPGLGLGLSYVKLISEAHHGSVSLRSNLGEGTSVTLYLPQWTE